MTSRPNRWDLLGADGDPVPANPDLIEDEGEHYTGVARSIAAQVERLRALAKEDVILKGEYAEALQESCRETADELEKAHGRFATVGSELSSWWGPAVRTARDATGVQVEDAEDAHRRMQANEAGPPPAPGSPPPTPEQKDAADAKAARYGSAQDDLEDAKRRYRTTMSDLEGKAERSAKKIRDAADDDMKDSKWDRFKDWVHRHAKILNLIADVIGWIVTIVAIVALFCTPAGWIMLLVAAVAVIGLGIRAALAMSGEGSWLDVAMDAIGILTLGTGKIATSLAKLGRMATLRAIGTKAGGLARTSAVAAARQAFKDAPLLAKPLVWLGRSNPLMRFLEGRAAYRTAYGAWVNRALPESGALKGILNGMDTEIAGMMDELAHLRTLNIADGLVKPMYANAAVTARTLAQVGLATDLTGKVFGDSFKDWGDAVGLGSDNVFTQGYSGFDFFADLKDRTTHELADPPFFLEPFFDEPAR